jgi:hypothetical protein
MACCGHEHPHHALGAAVGKITMHTVCDDVMLLLVGLGLGRATHVHTFAEMSEESAARAHTWAARQTPASSVVALQLTSYTNPFIRWVTVDASK